MSDPEITLVTESFNLDEGQSFEELRSSLTTVARYLQDRQDCEALLVDTSNDPRVAALVAAVDARIRHVRAPGISYDHAKDLAAEEARQLEEELADYRYLPVLSLGVTFRF